ncbi:MAG: hypothetical protein QE263_07385 [Vampirovibrionales bacterium]|nr:hypothetical protein [Vampirovibrionales bacterium]
MPQPNHQQPSSPQSRPFISANVLERLANGQFVAQRRSQPSLAQMTDSAANRRDDLSPLAVAKRCIPYEPKVFTDRRDIVLSLAHALNDPSIEVVLIEGNEGSGTTSVARGVVELMGGGPEQVLWVDVEPTLSDGDLVSFLIGYLNRIAASVVKNQANSAFGTLIDTEDNPDIPGDAMAQLRRQLGALSEKPVLIVMDHLGSRVNDGGFWNTTLLQELLHFLLAVPSVKVMLVGEHLPTGDMASLGSRLFSVNLTPPSSSTPPSTFLWHHLAQRIHASQWEHAPSQVLGGLLAQQLSREDQRIAALLACVRHSLNQSDLSQWSEDFKHTDPKEKKATALSTPLNASTLQHHLKASPLRPLIRRSLLPQQLLSVLALPPEQRPTHVDEWSHYRFSFYEFGSAMLAAHLPPLLVSKTHEFLSQQYLAQRKVPMEQRVLPVANSILVQEARYHEEQAQQARLRLAQQKTLQHLSAEPQTAHVNDAHAFSEADLHEIARHQERLTQSMPLDPVTQTQPTVIVVSSPDVDASLNPSINVTSPHSTPIPEPTMALFHAKLQPALSHVTSAHHAFAQQQWDVSQASLELALQQLNHVAQQSQQLQAVLHSRLAYVAAINQHWETAQSYYQHAQQYLNNMPENDTPSLGPWLVAQQCLTETLLPERYKPTKPETLCQRLLLSLHTCEAETATASSIENDPYVSFWQAVLPQAPLLAELTFRAATLLDAEKSEGSSVAYSAPQLYELAYTRLLETHQPFAAASAAANRAALFSEAKAYNQAIPWLQRALNLEEANDWTDEAAESHQRLAKAYAKTQQWQSALHHGDCVLRWLETEDNKSLHAETLARWQQRLGQWAKTGGFPNQAKVYWLSALETLYGMSRVAPLTPQQQAQQHELETAIRQQA